MARESNAKNRDSCFRIGRESILIALFLVSVGCGKIPTWSELTGGQQAPPQPIQISQPSPQAVTPPPTQPPEPPKPNAAEVIAGFKTLKPFEIGDLQLQQLASLTEGLEGITEVKAGGSGQISNNALASIAKLPAVKEVDLTGTRVDNEGVKALTSSQSLQSLNLSTTKVTDQGIATLTACPNLRKLNLQGCQITPEGFAAIGRMPVLEEINLDLTAGLNDSTLDLMCNARTIKSLHMRDCGSITDAGLVALSKLEVLEELNINRSRVTGEGFLAVTKAGGLKSIKYLGIAVNPINEKGARAINSMKSLEHLDLQQIAMDDQGFAKLAQGLKNLKYININEVAGVTSFIPLKASDEIEVIHAWKTNVNDVALGQLKTHKKLKSLDVGDTRCTVNGVMALKKILPECKIKFAGVEY